MAQSTLYRSLLVADGADADFGINQTVPGFAPYAVSGAKTIVVTMVAYKSDGTVSSGTVDLQLCAVGLPVAVPANPSPDALVTTSPVVEGVAIGAGVQFSVAGFDTAYVAVTNVADLGGDAVTVRLFVTGVE